MMADPTTSSRPSSIPLARSSAKGASDLLFLDSPAWRRSLGAGVKPAFLPSLVVQVKALACELPHRLGLPLSRLSISETRQHVITQGLVAEISGATLWRWLSSDALRPWQHRTLDLPSRSQLCGQSRSDPRSVRTPLGRRLDLLGSVGGPSGKGVRSL